MTPQKTDSTFCIVILECIYAHYVRQTSQFIPIVYLLSDLLCNHFSTENSVLLCKQAIPTCFFISYIRNNLYNIVLKRLKWDEISI